MKELLELFLTFARIGGLTFGGGLTMLPMLEYELVSKKKWLTTEEIVDIYAIGQCTPGIIAVNCATFVGYRRRGIAGGIAATLGMITPSLLIITVIAMFLRQFMDNVWIARALTGIRGVVCALMINTVLTLGKKTLLSPKAWIFAAVVFALAFFAGLPTIALVVLAAAAGIVLDRLTPKEGEA